MDLQDIIKYCLTKDGAQETFPFDAQTLVFKVGSKMFALTNINKHPITINLKCDPNLAIDLRLQFPAIEPGYHMSKLHWNTITIDGSISDEKIWWLIDHSYNLVVKGLKKSERELLRT